MLTLANMARCPSRFSLPIIFSVADQLFCFVFSDSLMFFWNCNLRRSSATSELPTLELDVRGKWPPWDYSLWAWGWTPQDKVGQSGSTDTDKWMCFSWNTRGIAPWKYNAIRCNISTNHSPQNHLNSLNTSLPQEHKVALIAGLLYCIALDLKYVHDIVSGWKGYVCTVELVGVLFCFFNGERSVYDLMISLSALCIHHDAPPLPDTLVSSSSRWYDVAEV